MCGGLPQIGVVGVVLESFELIIEGHMVLRGHESSAEVEHQCDGLGVCLRSSKINAESGTFVPFWN